MERISSQRLYSRRSFDTLVKSLLLYCAKLEAYGLGKKALSYTHSYLANRNQRVGINDTKSDFQKITSGDPHGLITIIIVPVF